MNFDKNDVTGYRSYDRAELKKYAALAFEKSWLQHDFWGAGWISRMCLRSLSLVSTVLLIISAGPVSGATFNNEAGQYALSALPDAGREAERMDRMKLSDQQPAGRYARKGETITVKACCIPDGYSLAVHIGFRPMWNVEQNQQEVAIDNGEKRFKANQDGPIFFKFIRPDAGAAAIDDVVVNVSGGSPLPLYVDGTMSAHDWRAELAAHAGAPFVQLIGSKAMITLPAKVQSKARILDPHATFEAIDQVIDAEDELAGFDGTSPRNTRTPLRLHYLVDFRASKKDRQNFYMYASDEFIGMQPDSTADLTDPAKLRSQWAIWHETGHTQQQRSWTWGALTEINVNLFSLYVQEKFGQPSRLASTEDEGVITFDKARAYLSQQQKDYLAEGDDYNELFTKLVMFHQLKSAFGWKLFADLSKHYRAHPLATDASDREKVDAFVMTVCHLTEKDMRRFFAKWGLKASDDVSVRIDAMRLKVPDRDYSLTF